MLGFRQEARQAAGMPMAGRKVPEIDRDDVREIILRNYRIVYLICNEEVRLLTVFEGHGLLAREYPSA
jgi:plasmid stabilization system protein ParE